MTEAVVSPVTRPARLTWRRLRADRAAVAALVFLVLVLVGGLLADWIAPHDPHQLRIAAPYSGPSGTTWLGTDDLGRDTLSRLLEGAGISMRFSLLTVGAALLLAVPLGVVSGYRGGWVDVLVMRVMDGIMSFPGLVLAIALVATLGASLRNAGVAVAVSILPQLTRLARAQALAVREETFVEASRSIGTSRRRILVEHILPNAISPVIVQASVLLGIALLAESSLSFLGLGAQPPTASWGGMIRRGYDNMLSHPWLIVAPGVAIGLTVLSFNLLGEGLRAALGPGQPDVGDGRLGLTRVAGRATSTRSWRSRRRADAGPPTAASGALLEVEGLSVAFDTPNGRVQVVEDVSFAIRPGEVLGLVGESGSGKSVTSLAIMRLLPSPPAEIAAGRICFDGTDLLDLDLPAMAALRGREISMVFQDPMASLNPSLTIEHQVAQVVRWHEGASRAAATARAREMLELVGIPARRGGSYPHEFSGGMRQRAMIAMALVARPRLLIADEPTTALDVTIQAQVLELLLELKDELGMAMLFVTHDLGVVAEVCDRVAVLYAGQVVETGDTRTLLSAPEHPYTEGLLRSLPQRATPREPLYAIPGHVPDLLQLPGGCRLADRCPYVEPGCRSASVELRPLGGGHEVRCRRAPGLVTPTQEPVR